jgi:hypothetical protein
MHGSAALVQPRRPGGYSLSGKPVAAGADQPPAPQPGLAEAKRTPALLRKDSTISSLPSVRTSGAASQ